MPNGIVDPSSSRFNSLIDRLGGSSCKWVVSVLLFLIISKPKNKHDFSIDYAPSPISNSVVHTYAIS